MKQLFAAVEDSVDEELCKKTEANETVLLERLRKGKRAGQQLYSQIQTINEEYKKLLEAGKWDEAKALTENTQSLNSSLLYIFRKEQDYFVRFKLA